jgi:hypothetical protein
MPPDAANNVQAFENRILAFYKRQTGPRSEALCLHDIKPERFPGGYTAYVPAWRALTGTGKLKLAGKSRKGGAPLYVLN